jgi:hypothetical protein
MANDFTCGYCTVCKEWKSQPIGQKCIACYTRLIQFDGEPPASPTPAETLIRQIDHCLAEVREAGGVVDHSEYLPSMGKFLRDVRAALLSRSTADDRLRELAREEAFNKHSHYCLDADQHGHVQGMNDKSWGFSTCPHPDCVLVRPYL